MVVKFLQGMDAFFHAIDAHEQEHHCVVTRAVVIQDQFEIKECKPLEQLADELLETLSTMGSD